MPFQPQVIHHFTKNDTAQVQEGSLWSSYYVFSGLARSMGYLTNKNLEHPGDHLAMAEEIVKPPTSIIYLRAGTRKMRLCAHLITTSCNMTAKVAGVSQAIFLATLDAHE